MYTLALDAFVRYTENLGLVPCKTHQDLVVEFCDKLNIKYEDLFNKSRKQTYVRYRALFCNYVKLTHVELGAILDKNHSSIMHLRRGHKSRLQFDREYKRLYNLLYSI